jgi:hypothetical protein
LFARREDQNYEKGFSETGVQNWPKIWDKVNKHERTHLHRQLLIAWKMIDSNALIDRELQLQIEKEMANWREVLKRIIDIILLLASQNLAFRGSVEKLRIRAVEVFLR